MKPLLLDELKTVLRADVLAGVPKARITGITTDSRKVQRGDLFIALRGERFDGHEFVNQALEAGAQAAVVDRRIPISATAQEQGACVLLIDDAVKALGQIGRFYRRTLGRQVTIIAVTGTNGKTTTRQMIHHVLSKHRSGHQSPANFNNAIGVPLTLLGIEAEHSFAVVEMGSNAPGEIADLSRIAEPDIVVITNIGMGHLQGLGDLEGVSVEKCGITAGLSDHGVIVCGTEHPTTLERVRTMDRHVIAFGLDGEADVSASDIDVEEGRISFVTNDRCQVILPLAGAHNVSNALAALAVVRRMGLTSAEFAQAMIDFKGVAGRMQYEYVNGITIINDTYNANPSSVRAALNELLGHRDAGRRVFVCGDMAELGPASQQLHRELGELVAASPVDLLLTVGSEAAHTAAAALEAGMGRGRVQRAISSVRLARLIKSMIRDDDVILVKGSRSAKMEEVVVSLRRWRGDGDRRERVRSNRTRPIRSVANDTPGSSRRGVTR